MVTLSLASFFPLTLHLDCALLDYHPMHIHAE